MSGYNLIPPTQTQPLRSDRLVAKLILIVLILLIAIFGYLYRQNNKKIGIHFDKEHYERELAQKEKLNILGVVVREEIKSIDLPQELKSFIVIDAQDTIVFKVIYVLNKNGYMIVYNTSKQIEDVIPNIQKIVPTDWRQISENISQNISGLEMENNKYEVKVRATAEQKPNVRIVIVDK